MVASAEHDDSAGLLLLDTCGEVGSVTLACKEDGVFRVSREVWLRERAASHSLLQGIRGVLQEADLQPKQLKGIGVFAGPGSFTGVRVGMATAKGMCLAAELPLVPISRLAVLAQAAQLEDGFAVLRAGPDQVYVLELREAQPKGEFLSTVETVRGWADDNIVYAEQQLSGSLQDLPRAMLVPISSSTALPLLLALLGKKPFDPADADAHYVRDEQAIYKRSAELRGSL